MIGCDNSGKTACVYRLHLGEMIQTTPTVGFNVETVQYKKLLFTIFDIGGQQSIRPLWRYYYEGTHAVIFMIDSNDRERLKDVKLELEQVANESQLKDTALLIFANKQDIKSALTPAELSIELNLCEMKGLSHRKWTIQGCSVLSGHGLEAGLDWLSNQL